MRVRRDQLEQQHQKQRDTRYHKRFLNGNAYTAAQQQPQTEREHKREKSI